MTFTGGSDSNTECLSITITEDDTYEEEQGFVISIVTDSPVAEIGTPSTATKIIQDANGNQNLFHYL